MKPYAILNLKTMKATQLDDRDTLKDACRSLTEREIKYIPFCYSSEDGEYQAMEFCA